MNHSASPLETLSERVANLEKQNRRLKQASALFLLCVAALVAMGQAQFPRVLRAKSFVVVDEAGRKRAELGMDGSPGLAIYDEKGRARAILDANADGSSTLGLYGEGLYPLLKLEAFQLGSGVSLYAPEDAQKLQAGGIIPRVQLQYYGSLGGQLSFQQGDKSLIRLQDFGPQLVIEDAQGYTVAVGTSELRTPATGESHKTSAASLILFDNKGGVIWRAP